MTALDRLRQLVSALPSDDPAVTFTRAGLVALLDEDETGGAPTFVRDLTVGDIAERTSRAPSTVRDWLATGALRGHKFRGEWRVTESALRDYLNRPSETDKDPAEVDISEWRRVQRG